jgi:type I restriction enzyme, S subunit
MSMSETSLPPQWAETTLDEIADIQGGIQKGKKRSSSLPLRDVPYLRVANVQRGYLDLDVVQTIQATEEEISQLRLQVGDVLFNEGGDRDKLGRGWIWSGAISECIHQNHVFRARIIDRILDPKLLSWYGNTVGQQYFFDEGKQTTNLASLNSSKLKALPVVVPPQREQTRIVEAIESYLTRLDDAMATLERVQRNLKRYRASVLKAAVEGRLVPTEAELARAEGREYEPAEVLLERILADRRRRWEEAELAKLRAKGKVPKNDKWKAKYVEPVGPDTRELPELPELPEGWCWAFPSQLLLRLQTGPFGSSLHKTDYVAGGTPVINPQHLQGFGICPSDKVAVGPDTVARLSSFRLQDGDIVLGRRGEMGRCALVGTRESGWLLGTGSLALKPVESINSAFFLWVLRSPLSVATLEGKSVGTTMTNLNQEILYGLPMPLPPCHEQKRIVQETERHFSLIENLEREVVTQLAKSSRLRQSILKWAFEGRLVDQDPTDEPAELLLERIRAERAAQPSRARRRRA